MVIKSNNNNKYPIAIRQQQQFPKEFDQKIRLQEGT